MNESQVKILRSNDACKYIGVSRATWYNILKNDPTAPKRVHLSPRTVGFYKTDIDEWLEKNRVQ